MSHYGNVDIAQAEKTWTPNATGPTQVAGRWAHRDGFAKRCEGINKTGKDLAHVQLAFLMSGMQGVGSSMCEQINKQENLQVWGATGGKWARIQASRR